MSFDDKMCRAEIERLNREIDKANNESVALSEQINALIGLRDQAQERRLSRQGALIDLLKARAAAQETSP